MRNYFERRVDSFKSQNPYECLESPMERRLYEAIKTKGAAPVMQFPVGSYFIDFAFPDVKLAVEYDGREYHGTKEAKERDTKRDEFLRKNGWIVYRINTNGGTMGGEINEMRIGGGLDIQAAHIANIVRTWKREKRDNGYIGTPAYILLRSWEKYIPEDEPEAD